jgi:hypothetical protein
MPELKDAEFLKKARDRFKYCLESWRDIRDEHDIDMRFLAGDSWDPVEKARRKGKIPAVHFDELTQFINQLINDVRQNKRAVKVLPKGEGATNKSADNRADWIRAIEYQSNAQTAYITAFEGAAGGSYGHFKLETYYENDKSFNLSVRICPIPNANTIVWDPDCKKYDCSDAEDCFEIDFISHEAFKRRFPKAAISEFSEEIQQVAPDWIKPKQVQLASYWKVKVEEIQLHLVDIDGQNPVVMRSDELPENIDKGRILKTRDCEDRRIIQYVMNGVEVLETNDPKDGKGWPGNWIPIIPVWGKELFIDEGSGSKRILMSLIRLARDPQRYLNYLASQELMEAKLTPRTPYGGPTGMFSNHADQWEAINDEPRAYVEWDTPEGYAPGSVKPERVPFIPNFQQYEMAKDAAKRSIMSAMGIAPLPTAAQRQNEKSGAALARIEGQRSQGSYHFIDNFDRSLECCGRQLDDLFDKIHDSPRDIPLRDEAGKHTIAKVNSPGYKSNKEFKGDHDVTITVGPSSTSQYEEASDFADMIAKIPGVFPLIGDLIVRLRRLGPIGEQIAERLTPPQFAQKDGEEPLPPHAIQQMSQLQQQNQQLNAAAQELEKQIKQLQMEKTAKMWEGEQRVKIAALQEQTKLVVAQASLERQNAETILQAELEKIQTILGQVHDHMLLDHQAQVDQNQTSHEASLIPPEPTNGDQPSG